MEITAHHTCPTCHQPLPGRPGRICALCNKSIKLNEKWRVIGSKVQHKNCWNPTLANNEPAIPAQSSFTEDSE